MISAIASAASGMQQASARFTRAAALVASGGDEVSGTVEQIAATAAFEASATMERAAGELVGALLHVVA